MLGARLHQRGLSLGYVPQSVVHRHYSGNGSARVVLIFTRDFTRGEIQSVGAR